MQYAGLFMSEFDLIRQLHERINGVDGDSLSACVVGIGDDGAVLDIPQGKQVVVTTDTLVEGVHFLDNNRCAKPGPQGIGREPERSRSQWGLSLPGFSSR